MPNGPTNHAMARSAKSAPAYTGAVTVLEAIDNTILVTSKPPEERLYHALAGLSDGSGLELHPAGDAKVSRWSTFATDEAIKDGRRVGLIR